jgi:hypothetical protein
VAKVAPKASDGAKRSSGPRSHTPINFHGLRSLAVMNGMHLMVVARNLGHVDTRMVEKHY